MTITIIDEITRWAMLAIGVLAGVYGTLSLALAKPTGSRARLAHGFFVWPVVLSCVLAVISLAVIALSQRVLSDVLPYTLSGFGVGWILLILLFIITKLASGKLASDGAAGDQTNIGYGILSASGLVVCSAVLLGISAVALFGSIWKTMAVIPLVSLSLGFWLAITFWSLPSALYRWLIVKDNKVPSADAATLCVQFRSIPGEMAFIGIAAATTAVAIGFFRFGEDTIAGRLYPGAVFAGSVLFGSLALPFLKPSTVKSTWRMFLQIVGLIIFLAGSGIVAYYLAVTSLSDINGFYCFAVGLGTAMLLMFTARYRPPFASAWSPFGIEVAIIETMMLLAAAVLAFRWMAGYGIALCAVGMMSSFPILFPVGAVWAASRLNGGSGSNLLFMSQAASRFVEVVVGSGAFLVLVALVRLFAEQSELGAHGIDITDPYPLIGLIMGACFPAALRALSQSSGRPNLSVASLEKPTQLRLGRWAAARTLGIWLIAAIAPVVVAFFWRLQAAGAFLVGLAAAELFLILTLWLCEVRKAADESVRLATRSTHALVVGSALVAVLFVPPLITATGALTRAVKIKGLLVLLAILFIWIFIVAWRRLPTHEEI